MAPSLGDTLSLVVKPTETQLASGVATRRSLPEPRDGCCEIDRYSVEPVLVAVGEIELR